MFKTCMHINKAWEHRANWYIIPAQLVASYKYCVEHVGERAHERISAEGSLPFIILTILHNLFYQFLQK